MNSYQKLKIKLREKDSEIAKLKNDLRQISLYPDTVKSLEIILKVTLESKIEEAIFNGSAKSTFSGIKGLIEAQNENTKR